MADKFRKSIPLDISYFKAEQPTHRKLNSANHQARAGTGLIEKAIGDIWNQSGDPYLYSQGNYLQIANLGRLLGEASFIAPAMNTMCPPDGTQFKFIENIGTNLEGHTTGYLRYKLSGAITTEDGTVFGSSVLEETDVGATGEYWVDSDTGRFRTYDELTAVDQISYMVEVDEWIEAHGATTANVIPNPVQDGFTSCRIENDGGTFYLYTAPRRPILGWTMPGAVDKPLYYPGSAGVGFPEEILGVNEDSIIPGDGRHLLWQNKGIDALADNFYRYRWPDVFPSMTVADLTVPDGMIYLWDLTNNTIVEGITFVTTGTAYKLKLVTTTQTTFLTGRASVVGDEAEATYNATEIAIITVGSSAARRLYQLSVEMLSNSYDRSLNGMATVSHESLTDMDPIPEHASLQSHYPDILPPWRSTFWNQDPHPSLLSRVGSQEISGETRDWVNNAMLGHLLLANQDPDNYLDAATPLNSYGVKFGSIIGGAIFQNDSGHLRLEPFDTSLPGGSVGRGVDITQDGLASTLMIDGINTTLSLTADGDGLISRILTSGNIMYLGVTNYNRLALAETSLRPIYTNFDLGSPSEQFKDLYVGSAYATLVDATTVEATLVDATTVEGDLVAATAFSDLAGIYEWKIDPVSGSLHNENDKDLGKPGAHMVRSTYTQEVNTSVVNGLSMNYDVGDTMPVTGRDLTYRDMTGRNTPIAVGRLVYTYDGDVTHTVVFEDAWNIEETWAMPYSSHEGLLSIYALLKEPIAEDWLTNPTVSVTPGSLTFSISNAAGHSHFNHASLYYDGSGVDGRRAGWYLAAFFSADDPGVGFAWGGTLNVVAFGTTGTPT